MANNWVNFYLQRMATSGNMYKSIKGLLFLTHPVGSTRVGHGSLFVTQPDPIQGFPDPTRPSRDRPMKNIVHLFCV